MFQNCPSVPKQALKIDVDQTSAVAAVIPDTDDICVLPLVDVNAVHV